MEDETEILFCPQCGTEQLCHKKKNGEYECEVCGSTFTEDEAQSESNTMNEEEEFF